ncbi:cellulose biosynthesis protein BcsD [Variovorax sp. J22P168]|uniref:cellulose biosynthesis protein BcsD n=1 Tax=Variovorax jilinensis TaxID=3053513 RepID=UPI002574E01B|nr:cellulose biosynthesis protein BcsD [Variovorax sp. J22P168]MDM0013467.1 cellulose biosynthesis protein BcsD [Variovorax sp. J22P168]
MTDQDNFLSYYQRSTCSAQWMEFNRALAAELSAGLPPEDVRQLFRRIGERVATALPIERCDTMEQLTAGFNIRWEAIDWGFATLQEEGDHLRIVHSCSPLAMAFGPESGDWAGGFFEGAYQAWFAAQGTPAELHVRAEGADARGLPQLVLRLERSNG